MRSTAAATAPDHCAPESAPSAKATWAGAGGGSWSAGSTCAGRWAPTPMVVSHHRPPRRPTTTSGTTSVAPAVDPAENETDPKATGPVPGSRTSSRTTACATTSSHHRPAWTKRSSPSASNVRARPQPTSPDPPRTHDTTSTASVAGRSDRSGPGSSTATVRATRGAGSPAGEGSGPGEDVTASSLRRPFPATPSTAFPAGRDIGKDEPMIRASLDKRPREVASMFDDVAARYDLTNDVLSMGQDRRWRRLVREAVAARPGERVLDIAAGTGTSSEPFADAGVDVVPADFSLGMLRVGTRRRPALAFTAADAMRLPFADGSFDAVTMSLGLRNGADPPVALREFLRVTRPGGRLVVCEFSLPTNAAFRKVYAEYLVRS